MNYTEQFWEKQFEDEKTKKKSKKTKDESGSFVIPFWESGEEVPARKQQRKGREVREVPPELARLPQRVTTAKARVQEHQLLTEVDDSKAWEKLGLDRKRVNIKPQKNNLADFEPYIQKASKATGVPRSVIVQFISKENPWWDPFYKVPGMKNSAFGLGQHIKLIREKYQTAIPGGYDIYNPEHQIMVTAIFLNEMKGKTKYPWEVAMAFYHTGKGVFKLTLAKIQEYMSKNKAVRDKIPPELRQNATQTDYFAGAIAFYSGKSFAEAKDLAIKYVGNKIG